MTSRPDSWRLDVRERRRAKGGDGAHQAEVRSDNRRPRGEDGLRRAPSPPSTGAGAGYQRSADRGERGCLTAYLEHYRTTLELKCDELSAEQLGTRSTPPSNISLLGLVRHMARVEHSWFRRVIEDRPDIPRFFLDDEEDGGFGWPGEADDALVAEARELWRHEVAHAREVLERTDLDEVVDVGGAPVEVRDIVVHMIEEYARHCGHADLVRERIDGRAGL